MKIKLLLILFIINLTSCNKENKKRLDVFPLDEGKLNSELLIKKFSNVYREFNAKYFNFYYNSSLTIDSIHLEKTASSYTDFNFTYENDKIKEIRIDYYRDCCDDAFYNIEEYNYDNNGNLISIIKKYNTSSSWKTILHYADTYLIEMLDGKIHEGKEYFDTYIFEYNSSHTNISRVSYIPYGSNEVEIEVNYSYDNSKNPFKGLLFLWREFGTVLSEEVAMGPLFLSSNNVKSCTINNLKDNKIEEKEFKLSYKDNLTENYINYYQRFDHSIGLDDFHSWIDYFE